MIQKHLVDSGKQLIPLEPKLEKIKIKGVVEPDTYIPVTLYFKDKNEIREFRKILKLNVKKKANMESGSKVLEQIQNMVIFNKEHLKIMRNIKKLSPKISRQIDMLKNENDRKSNILDKIQMLMEEIE